MGLMLTLATVRLLLFATLQQADDHIDAVFAEFPTPADRIAGESDAQRLETLVHLVRTVLIAVVQVGDVIGGLLVARIGPMLKR